MPIPIIIGIGVAAATAYGTKKGYDGYQKHSKSNEIVETAKFHYSSRRDILDRQEEKSLVTLTGLGKLELDIGQDFQKFSTLADALLQSLNKNRQRKLEIQLPQHKLQRIENYTYSAIGVLGSVAGAGAAGVAAGFAVYGGVMTFAAASTGTAISSLAGVAATNATLAAIGGGSLATGGLGIAGGTAILGVAVVAPVLAIAGWAYDTHGEEALKNAKEAQKQVDLAVEKLDKATDTLCTTETTAKRVMAALSEIHMHFDHYLDTLQGIDNFISGLKYVRGDIAEELLKIEDRVMLTINNGYALAAILTDIIATPLFKIEQKDGVVVTNADGTPKMQKDAEGSMILNQQALDAAVDTGLKSTRDYLEA